MTNIGTFIQDSAYPGKKLYVDNNQLSIEDNGPISVARIRELDGVGQIQWVSEDMRQMAYALEKPAPQPAAQPAPTPTPQPPAQKSSSSVFVTIIAIVAILAICAGAYYVFSSMQTEEPTETTPATETAPEAPDPAPAPEPPSDETT